MTEFQNTTIKICRLQCKAGMDRVIYFNAIWCKRWIDTVVFSQTILSLRIFKTILSIYKIETDTRSSASKTKLRNKVLTEALLAKRAVSRMGHDIKVKLPSKQNSRRVKISREAVLPSHRFCFCACGTGISRY